MFARSAMTMNRAALPPDLGTALACQWTEAAAEEREGGAQGVLTGFLRLHLEFLAARPEVGEALYAGPPDDAIGAHDAEVRGALQPVLAALEAAVEQGKDEGLFPAELDPAMAALHYLGVIQMSFVFWKMQGCSGSLTEIGRDLLGQWLVSLEGGEPPRKGGRSTG